MTSTVKRAIVRATIGVAAMIAVIAGTATAANAAVSPGYWSDNPEICQASNCAKPKNLVMFWQSILWADSQGQSIGYSFIDGGFGPNTHQATWRWQAYIGRTGENGKALTRDGRVGRNTWYAAWRHTQCEDSPEYPGLYECIYWGAVPGRAVLYTYDIDGNYLTFKKPTAPGQPEQWITIT